MDTNETGREPTEPTDAALLRDVRALVRVAKEWSAQPAGSEREIKAQFPLYDTIARLPSDIADRLRIDPMPNRPAPDEVAQLHGGMCPQIVAGNFIVQCNGIVRDKAGVLLFQLEDYAPLTARVAELGAERDGHQGLVNRLQRVRIAAFHLVDNAQEHLDNTGATIFDPWYSDLCDALDEYEAAPGKEPTDA